MGFFLLFPLSSLSVFLEAVVARKYAMTQRHTHGPKSRITLMMMLRQGLLH